MTRQSGVHEQFVGAIERGRTNPTLKALTKLAAALRCIPGEPGRLRSQPGDPNEIRKLLREAIKKAGDEELQLLYRLHRSL